MIKRGETKKQKEVRKLALTEILILILGTIAISYAIGSEIRTVEAQTFPTTEDLIGPGGTCGGQSTTCPSGQSAVCGSNGRLTCSGQAPSCTSTSTVVCPTGQTAKCSNGKQKCEVVQQGDPADSSSGTTASSRSAAGGTASSTGNSNSASDKSTNDQKTAISMGGGGAILNSPLTRPFKLGDKLKNFLGGVPNTGKIITYSGFKFQKINGVWQMQNADGTWTTGGNTLNDATIKDLDKLAGAGTDSLKTLSGKEAGQQILKNAMWAAAIYFGIQTLLPVIWKDESGVNAAKKAISIGYFTGTTLKTLLGEQGKKLLGQKIAHFLSGHFLGISGFTWIGIATTVIIFISLYKKSDQKTMTFECKPWQAPLGGKDCEKCNKQGLIPCTEYQCKSLGQGCNMTNVGTPDVMCIWNNRKDSKPPQIQPWKEVLPDYFSYKPDNTVNPKDKGVYIKYNDPKKPNTKGCIPAFMPFTFGITSDEPASCKVDEIRGTTFNNMQWDFGGSSTFKYNHSQTVSLPSPESLAVENITLKNGGNYELYVRCIDVNGNPKPDSASGTFVFKYCVDSGPDTMAPQILGTSIPTGMPIAYNQSTLDLELYVNEPADCKWSRDKDMTFSSMESNMTCARSVFEMNAQMIYKCTTTLNALQNRQENVFYFRCKDKPLAALKDRYETPRGYRYSVIGTQPLIIDSVGPNETIRGSTDPALITLTAQTSAGYNEGDATCYYSESCYDVNGKRDDYTMFYYATGESSYTHNQSGLAVSAGTYRCNILCRDLGGNVDTKSFEYRVEIDNSPPKIVRAYKESSYLKVIISEKGECVYGTQGCNYLFQDGVKMNTLDDLGFYTDWDTKKTFYIRCKDEYGNQPNSNDCSIVVRPAEIFNGQ